MKQALKEDLERSYELIYGSLLLKEDEGLVNKLKNVVSNVLGNKEETPTVQTPRIVSATSNTPEIIGNPLSSLKPEPVPFNGPIQYDKAFTHLDLTKSKDYNVYSQICQAFINKRNPNAGINGNMLASAAKNTYQSTKKYIPPELALAQLALEGGLSKDLNAKPIRTNNPFNVGNYDSGKTVPFRTKQEGINRYYSLIANDYMGDGMHAGHLAQNFVNKQGNRYASSSDYESKLNQIMKEVNNISQSIRSA